MANDQVEVMRQLGFDRFFVAGHDRGARVAHRMALDHPEKVRKVALLDILPTLHIWENTSIPPEVFIEKKISKKGIGLSIFDPEAFAEYVRCFNAKTNELSTARSGRCRNDGFGVRRDPPDNS